MDVSSIEVRYNGLPALSAAAVLRTKTAVAKAAFDIEGNAKTIVPVDTGNLKNSIQTALEPGGLGATVGPRNVEYAIYVEFGTYKMRAQPYMRPAAEKVRPAFIAAMTQIAKL